jgi:hypothetical protein
MCQSSYAQLQPVILLLVKFFILRGLVPIILNIQKKHIRCKSPLSDFFKFYLSFNTKSEPLHYNNATTIYASHLNFTNNYILLCPDLYVPFENKQVLAVSKPQKTQCLIHDLLITDSFLPVIVPKIPLHSPRN